MRTAGTFAFFFAVGGANIFIVLYTVLAKWWKKPFGRHLFSFMAVIALALNYIVVQLIWPHAPYRLHTRFFLYAALATVIWWRIIILVTVQIRGARASESENTEENPRGVHHTVASTTDTNAVVVEE